MDGKMFCLGLAVGMLGGALIVANSHKARHLIKDGQDKISKKAEELSKHCLKDKNENYKD